MLFLALLLLLPGRVTAAISSSLHLLMMLRTHLGMASHLLIHRMLAVSNTCVFIWFPRMHLCFVSANISFVPVKVFGGVLVPVFSNIPRALAVMFRQVCVLVFSRSP